MNARVKAGAKTGAVAPPSSKSVLHRMLIASALAKGETVVRFSGISRDVLATADCLRALGAQIESGEGFFRVGAIKSPPEKAVLYCGESGSTLRFLIPVAAALGTNAVFVMEGRLPERPTAPLLAALSEHGVSASARGNELEISGKLRHGEFSIAGNVSSQFTSGLLFALPLCGGDSVLTVTGSEESAPYAAMTRAQIESFGVKIEKENNRYYIKGSQNYRAKGEAFAERDWSGAAAFLAMGAFSERGVTARDMPRDTMQGDRAIADVLSALGAKVSVKGGDVTVRRGELRAVEADASDIPDLVPVISAAACGARGKTRIYGASRLRLKESDRLQTTAKCLSALGADITETDDGLIINGKESLRGGRAEAFADHRIAMAAAVAACASENDVTVEGAECVEKSYPFFWRDLDLLEVEK